MPKLLFYILLIYAIPQNTSAQVTADDSSLFKAGSKPIEVYYQALGEQSPIYTGSEYIESPIPLQEGHVFFETNVFVKGTVYLDGMLFTGVPIMYDIVKDQLIIQHYTHLFKINIPLERVEYFILSGHTFVRLLPDSSNAIKAGFYDRLYNGKIMLLAKREKTIKEGYVNVQLNNAILQKTIYYIKKDGHYHIIKNMRSLLSVLKNKKKEIQQYLNSNKIKFKKDPEHAMIVAAEYFDRITN